MRRPIGLAVGGALAWAGQAWGALAAESWYPAPVDERRPPLTAGSAVSPASYKPLEAAKQPWRLCVVFPHAKDSYWLAVHYGLAQEVQRLGVTMEFFHAGGYENLTQQNRLLGQCGRRKADAVILGAISTFGSNGVIEQLAGQGLPVVDLVNGASSPHIAARSLVDFAEMGRAAGRFLVGRHPKGGPPARIAWYPGPAGANWVEAGHRGFMAAIADGAINVVDIRYGDTGLRAQSGLIRETLNQMVRLDYLAGTAVSIEAALLMQRDGLLPEDVALVSYYFSPPIYQALIQGKVLAAPTDSPVIQGRIAADQAVRAIEKNEALRDVGPKVELITGDAIAHFQPERSLPPRGWRLDSYVGPPGSSPALGENEN